jgi:hypothetical protein
MITKAWRMSITMPLSHCLHKCWIMPESDYNMPNHHSTSFWVVSCWVANYFFFFLFNSWRVSTKIGYIGWYYWLAICSQSSSCSDVHSPQSSCSFFHLVTKRNLCNTLMSILSLGIPKEQCQIQRLWSQIASEIVEQFIFLLVSCQETRQHFQHLCMWSKEVNMPSSTLHCMNLQLVVQIHLSQVHMLKQLSNGMDNFL